MNKKSLKNNTEYNKWNQANLVNQIKKEFLAFVKSSKKGKDFINNIDFIGWERIIEISNIEIESLVQAFKIPSAFAAEIWYTTFYEIEILKLIKNYLFPKILLEMEKIAGKHINQRKKSIDKITKQAEVDIKEIVELFKIQTKFSDLKWIKESADKDSVIDEFRKQFAVKLGKQVGEERLMLYYHILIKNDELIRRGEKSNYSKAANMLTNKTGKELRGFNKAFNKWMNHYKIYNCEDFKKKCLL